MLRGRDDRGSQDCDSCRGQCLRSLLQGGSGGDDVVDQHHGRRHPADYSHRRRHVVLPLGQTKPLLVLASVLSAKEPAAREADLVRGSGREPSSVIEAARTNRARSGRDRHQDAPLRRVEASHSPSQSRREHLLQVEGTIILVPRDRMFQHGSIGVRGDDGQPREAGRDVNGDVEARSAAGADPP